MSSKRLQSIDLLRGVAIILMVIYHFCYDLNYFGLTQFNFHQDMRWVGFRTVIVSLFLFLVGFSLWLGHHQSVNWLGFLRRLMLLGGCAVLVSLVTWYLFGNRWVYFGILHFIFVASVLGVLFLRFYWLNLTVGIALIALGATVTHPVFNSVFLNWVGLTTVLPSTEDYVPMIPWFGIVLLGLFSAQWLFRSGLLLNLNEPHWFGKFQWLSVAGRHGLLIYMIHQPLLMGVLSLWVMF